MEKIVTLLLVLASLQGIVLGGIKLDVEPPGTSMVLPGEDFIFKCAAGLKLQYCKIHSGSDIVNLSPLIKHKKYVYEGDGLDKGHCGVKILNVEEKNNGPLKCEIAFLSESRILTFSIDLIVARPPREKPDLVVVNAANSQKSTRYKENETIIATCTVKNARPAPKIQWYIGDKEITRDLSRVKTVTGSKGNIKVKQTFTFKVKKEDNNHSLVCVATHTALERPLNTSFHIEVLFPPSNDVYKKYLYDCKVGKKVNITVEVSANPKPSCKWEIDNVIYDDWSNDSHYRTMPATKKSSEVWECMLEITQVEEGDLAKTYILRAYNELGNTSFKFVLLENENEKPDEVELSEFGADTLIRIVAGVLALLLIIFLIFFIHGGFTCGVLARAGSEESTNNERADHGPTAEKAKSGPCISLSYLLGNKKDRVAVDVEEVKEQNVGYIKDAEKVVVPLQNINEGPKDGGNVVLPGLGFQTPQRPADLLVVRKEEEIIEYADIIQTASPEA